MRRLIPLIFTLFILAGCSSQQPPIVQQSQKDAVDKRMATRNPVIAKESEEDVWKDWEAEWRRQCPSNHLEWFPDGSTDDLLGDFYQTLSPSLQHKVSAIADYSRRCSMEEIGFACEMSINLDAFNKLGLLKRFTAFACHHYKCVEASLCTLPKP